MNSIEYLEHLWWVMHHSEDPDRRTFAVTCYLDESGTHGDSPKVIVAGLVLNFYNYLSFDVVWNNMLSQFNIKVPLHMKEFGRHGKLGFLDYTKRFKLFDQVEKIINLFKTHSVAFILDQAMLSDLMDPRIIKINGPYGMCFMGCAHMVLEQAEYQQYRKRIAFLLEAGNEHAEHIRVAHQSMIEMGKNVGTLAFEPKRISALQAADVIAWGARRRAIGDPIGKGFQPISKIFDENHIQSQWEESWLKNLNDSILNKSKNDPESDSDN